MKTEQKVRELIGKTGMLNEGDCVIAGVSGGADSVFLFYMLLKLRREFGYRLRVVHVHHGLRGEEADRDAVFTEELCRRHGIDCKVVRRDVRAEAKRSRLSAEDMGRRVRREIFRREAEAETGPVRIALAHHQNDAAETLLFRLARGTGIGGLAGMRPVSPLEESEALLIRPLLVLQRAEIEEELRSLGAAWCEDSTNAEDEASRNRLRHGILPSLVREINPESIRHMAALAEEAGETEDFLAAETERRRPLYLRCRDGEVQVLAGIGSEMKAMQLRILREALREAAGGRVRDIGRIHAEILLALLKKNEGAAADLPFGLCAVRDTEGLRLRHRGSEDRCGCSSASHDEAAPLVLPGEGEVNRAAFRGAVFTAAAEPAGLKTIPQKPYTKWIDYDKIKGTLFIRTRRQGDYLEIAPGRHKSLSDYFTDEKLPHRERENCLLVADGSEIVWIVGRRLGYRYRVTDSETRCLRLTAELPPESRAADGEDRGKTNDGT